VFVYKNNFNGTVSDGWTYGFLNGENKTSE
jgi:hypothetical protein